jgi:alcohol dehydrogenase, propanol-preferring
MKAWVLSKPQPIEASPLAFREVSSPELLDDHVLVRVVACGVCRTDLHVVEGDLAPRKSDVIPGHQVVGKIEARGENATRFPIGARVGIAWLHRTCGICRYCSRGAENLCEAADFTGYTVDGGYAEYVVAPEEFIYEVPEGIDDVQAAPLLCAGIIGFRCLRLSALSRGAALGIYGFGSAGHVTIQVARYLGISVYVFTREMRHQSLAAELGATWVGGADADPSVKLDAAIIFAPAGELVPVALGALDKGGTLILGGIHMSDIPTMPYRLLYYERIIRSVANNTRRDGDEFLKLAARIPIHTNVEAYPFVDASRALQSLKRDQVRGSAVLTMT